MMLSGLGQIATDVAQALKYADRARYVQCDELPRQLRKLRIRKLELSYPPPPWIGELKELRTLQCGAGAKLPTSLFSLPKLRYLHVDNTELANLDGIDKLPSLETVTFSSTPLGDDDDAVAALIKKLKGAKRTQFITGIDFDRKPAPAPKNKKKLIDALRRGTLDDTADLRKADLSGETFEDLLITYDLRGAKLANTTWLRCDFDNPATLSGADLSAATFYDCYFSSRYDSVGNLRGVKAPGATWVGCGGSLQLDRSDLRGASFLDMDPDVALDLIKAKGAGLMLEVSFCSEKEHMIDAAGADLRGARVHFDITPDRRAELKKKKTARLAWKQTHLKGAKTDKTTVIEYAALDAASAKNATRPAESTVDPKGKAAQILGSIYAPNASLWLIVADAKVAAMWRGSVDESDKKDDFQRALKAKNGPIAIGAAHGVRVEIGYRSGISDVYAIDNGVLLLDCATSVDDGKERDRALALRVAQWKVTAKPKSVGKLHCVSGVLAMMLPYRDGAFSKAALAKAHSGKVVRDPDGDRILIPMPKGPGVYEVAQYPFRPEAGRGDYEDEVGDFGLATVIKYRDRLPKAKRR